MALVLGVIVALLPVAQTSANGPHVGSQEVFAGPAEPYYIRILTAPVVGNLHLTIYVSQLGGTDPVSDARVQVMGRGPEGGSQTVGPVLAAGSLTGPNWYGVNLLIEGAGEWVFTLTVESSLGEATVDFPVKVQESGGINWVVLGPLGVVLGIVAWLALSRRQGMGRRPERRQRGPGQRR